MKKTKKIKDNNNSDEMNSQLPKPTDTIIMYDNPYRVIVKDNLLPEFITKTSKLSISEKIHQKSCVFNDLNYKFTMKNCLKSNEKLLNLILPPKSLFMGNELFKQNVSSYPSKDLDIVNLLSKLNDLIKTKSIQTTGICSKRRKIYQDIFQELIRQVTIVCLERGLLLKRINDELQMNLRNLQTTYESGIAYGMNKLLKSVSRKETCKGIISKLESEIEVLKMKVTRANNHIDNVEANEQKKYLNLKKKCDMDFNFMKKNYEQIKKQLIEAIENLKNPIELQSYLSN